MRFSLRTSKLITTATKAVLNARARVEMMLRRDPELRFVSLQIGEKKALWLDLAAEEACRVAFEEDFGSEIKVLGEETLSLSTAELPRDRVCVLVDMIDGTELLAMWLSLWCSAIVIFDPGKPQILGVVISLPSGEIYVAVHGEPAYVLRAANDPKKREDEEALGGPSNITALRDARVCYFGQKAKNCIGVSESRLFRELIPQFVRDEVTNKHSLAFRLYNFAGNPMMVRLVDRVRGPQGQLTDLGVDAVFDVAGQMLHDVVPGAYIALRAGAYLCDLDGHPISEQMLAERLLKPASRMKYVLAATESLAQDLCEALKPAAK